MTENSNIYGITYPLALDYTFVMKKRILLLILCCLVGVVPSYSEVIEIRHPVPQETQDPQRSYFIQLLALAFSKVGLEPAFRSVPLSLSQERQLLSLNGNQMDVMWTMTSKEREQIARPIRIPIMKGLLGYRVMVIHDENLNDLSRLTSVEELKKLVGIQGHDWPDTKILRENGLSVQVSKWFPDMYRQLAKKKVDYFPRGLLEAFGELDKFAYPNLTVLPKKAIYYPTALYYFVSNSNETLGKTIERGLKIAVRDGSFDRLFYEFPDHAKALGQFDHKKAKVFQLENSSLPKATPLDERSYWLDLK